jgi:hypothetical protein
MNSNVILGIGVTVTLAVLGGLMWLSNRQARELGAMTNAATNITAGEKANEEVAANSNSADVVAELQNGAV